MILSDFLPGVQVLTAPKEAGGVLVPLELGQWRERLSSAFQACGIYEEWIVSTLLEVVSVRLKERQGDPLTIEQLSSMIVTALNHSGFTDVACCLTGGDAPAGDSGEGVSASPGTGVTVEDDSSELPALLRPTRYISVFQWEKLFRHDARRHWIDERVLQLMPASDLFPIAVVKCHLMRLYDLGDTPEIELQWVTRLRTIAMNGRDILLAMCAQMRQQWPEVSGIAAHLYFSDFSDLAKASSLSTRKRVREAWRRELSGVLADGQTPVLVHFS